VFNFRTTPEHENTGFTLLTEMKSMGHV